MSGEGEEEVPVPPDSPSLNNAALVRELTAAIPTTKTKELAEGHQYLDKEDPDNPHHIKGESPKRGSRRLSVGFGAEPARAGKLGYVRAALNPVDPLAWKDDPAAKTLPPSPGARRRSSSGKRPSRPPPRRPSSDGKGKGSASSSSAPVAPRRPSRPSRPPPKSGTPPTTVPAAVAVGVKDPMPSLATPEDTPSGSNAPTTVSSSPSLSSSSSSGSAESSSESGPSSPSPSSVASSSSSGSSVPSSPKSGLSKSSPSPKAPSKVPSSPALSSKGKSSSGAQQPPSVAAPPSPKVAAKVADASSSTWNVLY